jgi:hypothetical protein
MNRNLRDRVVELHEKKVSDRVYKVIERNLCLGKSAIRKIYLPLKNLISVYE